DRSIGSELDAILLQAVQVDRDRRYQTVDALSSDIRRHLAGRAVLAHAPGALYVLRKLIARNRSVSVLTGLLLSATVLFVWSTLAQSHSLAQERDRARTEARNAKDSLSFFMEDVVLALDPRKRGRDVTVGEALAASIDKIHPRFASMAQEVVV